LFAMCFPDVGAMATDRLSVIGWIEIVRMPGASNLLTVLGHVQGIENRQGKFQLSVTRNNRGNKSATKQSGDFRVTAGEAANLSSTTINVSVEDHLSLELILYSGDKELFVTRLQSYP
jgi:hypothetical protein